MRSIFTPGAAALIFDLFSPLRRKAPSPPPQQRTATQQRQPEAPVGGALDRAVRDAATESEEQLLKQAEAIVDMRAPLVWQIHRLTKGQYLAWTHSPFHYAEEPKYGRLFASDLLEPFSMTSWWAVPMFWLPVVAFMWTWYIASPGASLAEAAGIQVAGLVAWTLVEYVLHRFLFHLDDWLPDNGVALTAHFLLHGIHHRIPMDRFRLVMPPVMAATLAGVVYGICRLLIPLPWAQWQALFASGLLGYICYDMVHYSQHHVRAHPESYLGRMKRYHMKHHFSGQQNVGYGITSKAWDYLFGTMLDDDRPQAAPLETRRGR